MKENIIFTQNDFPFPYSQGDVWDENKELCFSYELSSGVFMGNIRQHLYDRAISFILVKDKGAILNALHTTKHNISQEEVDGMKYFFLHRGVS